MLRNALIKIHWLFSSQIGFNPQIFLRSLRGLPRYLRDWMRFRKSYSGTLKLLPCLHDWYEEAGSTKSEYFRQDLLVARMIFEKKETRAKCWHFPIFDSKNNRKLKWRGKRDLG